MKPTMFLRRWLAGGAMVLVFAGGLWMGNKASQPGLRAGLPNSPGFTLPTAAQQAWFPPMKEYANGGEPLEEAQFAALFATLQERLAAEDTLADFEREAPIYLHGFVRRTGTPELRPSQVERAIGYFSQLRDAYPEHSFMIDRHRARLEGSAPGNSWALPFSMATSWFPETQPDASSGAFFSDGELDRLVEVLDALLSMPETIADMEREAVQHVRAFTLRLRERPLTDEQVARMGAYLGAIKARHPETGSVIDESRYLVDSLSPGRVAPNIRGSDLDGVEFELRDYRGKIVILYFTGHWCGPCRSEYPYQRFMLELFADHPVTILAVNSDGDIEDARLAKEEEGLAFRAWWDGHGEMPQRGPIATAWHVTGWPATYILDGHGVIRHVNERHLNVISAVDRLLEERQPAAS